jgi:hypothetical protein
MNKKDEAIQERAALIEMYQAGFTDGFKLKHKLTSKKDNKLLNILYKKAFVARFEKAITQHFEKIEAAQ